MSSWFRDYLYIPLGGDRCGPAHLPEPCGGFSALRTVAWRQLELYLLGIFHGFFLVIERTIIGKGMQLIWAPLRHLVTLIIIIVGWVLFRSDTINDAITYISIMFNTDSGTNWQIVLLYLNPKILFELAMAALFSFPVLSIVKETTQKLMSRGKTPSTLKQ